MYKFYKVFFYTLLFTSTVSAEPYHERLFSEFESLIGDGGALVQDGSLKTLFAYHENDLFIPASTLKLATSFCALETMGPERRFGTDFEFDPKQGRLFVKGFGDPGLTSVEIQKLSGVLSNTLKAKNYTAPIKEYILDTSYFSDDIEIDGSDRSSNPYDAANGALIANFNTIFVCKSKKGVVTSAEKETPITEIAKEAAKTLKPGTCRVNLGRNKLWSARYFIEILDYFLVSETGTKSKARTKVPFSFGTFPVSEHKITYLSSPPLREVVRGMLDFSTNFTANQLFLILGAESKGSPANINQSRNVLKECLTKKALWKDFEIWDGAGLSRKNQVSPNQMLSLFYKFKPYYELLPLKEEFFYGKTGTLNGVSTLTGYFFNCRHEPIYFSLLLNGKSFPEKKFIVAKKLKDSLSCLNVNGE